MAFSPIEGLFYQGKQVGFDDGAVVVTPPPVVTPPVTLATTYPIQNVTLQDAMYLYKMAYDYRQALKNLPGTHQVHYDILTNGGKTWAEMTGLAQQNMQVMINRVINLAGSDNAAATSAFDAAHYTGSIVKIYNNLVASKLGI